jgi:hypothetical protein
MNLPSVESPQQLGTAIRDELELDRRMSATVAWEERCEHAFQGLRRGSDTENARVSGQQGPSPIGEGLGADQELSTLAKQVCSLRPHLDPSADAIEEPHAELGFKSADLA